MGEEPTVHGRVLFWIAFPVPDQDDIRVDPSDRQSPLLPELEEAVDEIIATLQRQGWQPRVWDLGYYDDRRLSALFWAAFPLPHQQDMYVDPDDSETHIIPELNETGAEVDAVLRRKGWQPSGWDFRPHDDRPPSELMALEPWRPEEESGHMGPLP